MTPDTGVFDSRVSWQPLAEADVPRQRHRNAAFYPDFGNVQSQSFASAGLTNPDGSQAWCQNGAYGPLPAEPVLTGSLPAFTPPFSIR